MGLFQASNIAQRAANAFIEVFCEDADVALSTVVNTPKVDAWLQDRRSLNAACRCRQDRVYKATQYTDDVFGVSVGILTTVVLLLTWYRTTRRINLLMATAAKRQLGSSALSLGALVFV